MHALKGTTHIGGEESSDDVSRLGEARVADIATMIRLAWLHVIMGINFLLKVAKI